MIVTRKAKYILLTVVLWCISAGTGIVLSLNWETIYPIKEAIVELISIGLIAGTFVAGGIFALRVLLGPAFLGGTNYEKYGEYKTEGINENAAWYWQLHQLVEIGEKRRNGSVSMDWLEVKVPRYWAKYDDFDINQDMKFVRQYGNICHIRVKLAPEEEVNLY